MVCIQGLDISDFALSVVKEHQIFLPSSCPSTCDLLTYLDNLCKESDFTNSVWGLAHNGTEKRVFRPQCSFDVTAQI